LRPQSGEGEECRQEQDRDDIVELPADVAGEPAVVRDEHAEQERPENGVNADGLRG
jgi:hypothetical protein